MKYRGIFEYEYPVEHKMPFAVDVYLHGDCVKGKVIEWEYKPIEQEPTITIDELKEIRGEIEHCSSRYNLAREQGCQGQVVWSEYLYKQGDVLAILDKKISELEGDK